MARLKLGTIILPLVLFLMIVGTSAACPEGVSCDSAKTSNQLHEGARSLRFLGGSDNSASVGGKYHFSDHQAIQASLSLHGYGSRWKNKYQNEDESSSESIRFGFAIGTQYFHYYKPESTISPFVGCGASAGMKFSRNNSLDSFSDNNQRGFEVFYDFGLQAIFGFEWQLSERISLVSEQVVEISYTWNKYEYESSRTNSQESFRQSVDLSYRIMSLGFAFYLR